MNTTNTCVQLRVRPALLTSLASICLTLIATSTWAADETPGYAPATKRVEYADLNLANPDGVKRLYDRIVAAAKQVCDSRDYRTPQVVARDRLCVQQSIVRAVKAVDRPELTAFHAAKTGQPVARVAAVAPR